MQKLEINLDKNKKIFFASDFHLGAPNKEQSRSREKKIIRWLESIEKDAAAILLVCLLYTSPSPRDGLLSRMPSSA